MIFRQITSLTRSKHKNSNIIFTNHNVLDLPFVKFIYHVKNTFIIPSSEQINLINYQLYQTTNHCRYRKS